MANRRMFAKSVLFSDTFLDLSPQTRDLYIFLAMNADDDGFVSNIKGIGRMICAKEDDIRLLSEKGYIILFDSGVIAITHWKLHNLIRSDRYSPTIHTAEMSMLTLDENKVYRYAVPNDTQMSYQWETQYSIGEDRGEKESEGEGREQTPPPAPAFLRSYGEYRHVKLSDKQYDTLIKEYGQELVDNYIGRIDKYCQTNGKKYFDYELLIKEWIKEDGADNGIISGNTVTVRDSAYSTDI